ncbi:MAG TPA: thioredoxin-disulfide reductase [Nitrospirae bacterium]|nr:thioredoxin-disulfide reductase [Nitrospirota bacterium]
MYDCVVIGGGPGGICAAIYAIRAGLKTVILEKLGVGGQIAVSDIIENYPGFPSISGPDLMRNFEDHAKSVKAELVFTNVKKIETGDEGLVMHTAKDPIKTKTVVICSGAEPKHLGFKGEMEFMGRGVSTCGTCDGNFYRNKPVAVIGGGDTAVKESIFLSRIVDKIYHIHRRDRFRAEKVLQDRIMSRENIEFCWKSNVEEALGDDSGVTGLRIKDIESGKTRDLAVDGIFVFVGINPNTSFVDCKKDDQGFIITDVNMATSIPGVFAAGDCRVTPLRQVSTAVGDAAIAAFKADEYISELEGRSYEKVAKL